MLVHKLTILCLNRKYIETTLSIMPLFYLLVPNCISCAIFLKFQYFIPKLYIFTYLISHPEAAQKCLWTDHGNHFRSGKRALIPAGHTSTSLCVSTIDTKWPQASAAFHNCSCLQSRVVMTCWEPEWEICDARMEASETFIKGMKVPWL